MRNLSLARHEQSLKWLALALGIAGAVAASLDLYPWTLFLSIPFCLIWIYCAWLHNEVQLKYINMLFTGVYALGVVRYFYG